MPSPTPAATLYGDLLIRCLSNTIYGDPSQDKWHRKIFDAVTRSEGRDWPSQAHTMIGLKRLENLRKLVETVIAEEIPGDLIETGVWRGGACILMRGLLAAHGVADRQVIVADSFQGLPKPQKDYPQDKADKNYKFAELAISVDQVKANFAAYGLLDGQVEFLKGWFQDTLPTLKDRTFALVRLDGDMYQSTMDGLVNLYDRLSPGGFIIIDDHGAVPACAEAVADFRRARGIDAEMVTIDWTGVYWQKPS